MRKSARLRTSLLLGVAGAVMVSGSGASAATVDWRTITSPEVSANLEDIAVIGTRDAWAVGAEWTPEKMVGMAEHWDGQRWTKQTVPGSPSDIFTDVSASGSDDVWVLADTHGQGPSFRRWDGTEWTQPTPEDLPGIPGRVTLRDISAVSPDDAWAVGSYSPETGPRETLVQRWDGQAWSRVGTPDRQVELVAVSALAPDNVWAVGWHTPEDFNVLTVLRWDGQTWHTTLIPVPGKHAQLMDIRAVSDQEVWATGQVEGQPVAMLWDGAKWRVLPRPDLSTTAINSVAPDGNGGAWIAGHDYSDVEAGSTPLYLHWDGEAWRQGGSEAPDGVVTALGAVSGGAIWAVGTTSWCSCLVGQPLVQMHGRLPRW
ncbi:MAG: hypothetical protein ACRDTQ_17360 [Micromonosporaceae bacterium]